MDGDGNDVVCEVVSTDAEVYLSGRGLDGCSWLECTVQANMTVEVHVLTYLDTPLVFFRPAREWAPSL
jgi:hypothetical protein